MGDMIEMASTPAETAKVTPPHRPAAAREAAGDRLTSSPALSEADLYNKDVLDVIAHQIEPGVTLKDYRSEAVRSIQQALVKLGKLPAGAATGHADTKTQQAFDAYRGVQGPSKPADAVAPHAGTARHPVAKPQAHAADKPVAKPEAHAAAPATPSTDHAEVMMPTPDHKPQGSHTAERAEGSTDHVSVEADRLASQISKAPLDSIFEQPGNPLFSNAHEAMSRLRARTLDGVDKKDAETIQAAMLPRIKEELEANGEHPSDAQLKMIIPQTLNGEKIFRVPGIDATINDKPETPADAKGPAVATVITPASTVASTPAAAAPASTVASTPAAAAPAPTASNVRMRPGVQSVGGQPLPTAPEKLSADDQQAIDQIARLNPQIKQALDNGSLHVHTEGDVVKTAVFTDASGKEINRAILHARDGGAKLFTTAQHAIASLRDIASTASAPAVASAAAPAATVAGKPAAAPSNEFSEGPDEEDDDEG